jgi:hypothetical protein
MSAITKCNIPQKSIKIYQDMTMQHAYFLKKEKIYNIQKKKSVYNVYNTNKTCTIYTCIINNTRTIYNTCNIYNTCTLNNNKKN